MINNFVIIITRKTFIWKAKGRSEFTKKIGSLLPNANHLLVRTPSNTTLVQTNYTIYWGRGLLAKANKGNNAPKTKRHQSLTKPAAAVAENENYTNVPSTSNRQGEHSWFLVICFHSDVIWEKGQL